MFMCPEKDVRLDFRKDKIDRKRVKKYSLAKTVIEKLRSCILP